MQVWLRLLIVWFIALALPVQGMAGAAMVHCGAGHERMGAKPEAAHHHASVHDAGAAHHHGLPVAKRADAPDHEATPSPAEPRTLAELAKYKCSSCASCCAGTALPSVMPLLGAPASAPAVFAEAMVAVDPFVSDGPDRPPRA